MPQVQGTANNNAGTASATLTGTFGASTKAGNALIVSVQYSGGTCTVTNNGQSITSLAKSTADGNGYFLETFALANITGGATTVIAAFSPNEIGSIETVEWSGVVAVSASDGTPNKATNTSSTSWTTGSITTSWASDLLVISGMGDSSPSTTLSSYLAGFSPVTGTNITASNGGGYHQNTTDGDCLCMATRIVGPGTYSGGGTWAAVQIGAGTIIALKLLPSGGATLPAYPGRAPFKGPPGLHLRAIDMWAPSPSTNVVGTISGLAVSSSTALGSVAGTGAISGVAASQSTANGSVTGLGQISGLIVSASTVLGNAGGRGQISGVAVSSSTANGLVVGSGAISGIIVSTSTALGEVDGLGAISGLSISTSTVFGFAADAGSVGVISGMAISSSTALGSIVGVGQISGLAAASTTVTGTINASGQISGMSVSTTVAYGSVTAFVPSVGGQSLMVGFICNVGTLDDPDPRL